MKHRLRMSLAVLGVWAFTATASPDVTLTILETSDLHGHLMPWDYARARPSDEGLARVATRIRAIRASTKDLLLLDAGDTIQGSPIEYLHARRDNTGRDPMAEAMSVLQYDAMAVGNHEYNYGLAVLRKAEKESTFPWLSANTRNVKDGSPAFREYVVKTVGGVRVGILGLTTPNIPGWEPEANRPGLTWEEPVVTAKRLVPVLRGKERCDLVVVLIHSGPEVDLATMAPDGTAHENRVVALATEVPGIDLLLTGHKHQKIPLTRINGVPIIQPGRWGEVLARVDVTMTKKGSRFIVANVTGELLPSDASLAADAEIAKIAEPHEKAARAWLEETLAVAEDPFPGLRARVEDTALLDFVNDTQLAATGADLSETSLLPGRYEGFKKGPITVRDVFGLYPYENQLVAVEIDGKALRSILEHAAEFYREAKLGAPNARPSIAQNREMIPYNFDVIAGASYRIDPTAPVGSRIRDLSFKGRPVVDTDKFSIAVNAYRAQGAGGYTALKGAKVLKFIPTEIRDLLIERLKELKTVRPTCDHNWVVAPDFDLEPAPPRGGVAAN